MSRASGARWRSAVAGVLIIVGTLAIPLAATASWVKAAAFDTDHFVATTAELRNDPAVQEAIVHGATQAIMTGLEIEARTRGGLAGLAELAGLPPRTSELLPALSGPITLAIEEFVEQQVGRVVESDQFGGLWDASARALHGQVLALLQADEGSLLGVEDGAISLRIGVVVDASRDLLLAEGFTLARFIPDSQATLRLLEVNPATVDTARAAYRALATSTVAFPIAAAVALIGAVLIANDRMRAVRRAGFAVALAGVVMLLALQFGTGALASALTGSLGEPGADRVAGYLLANLRNSATIILVSGVAVAAIGLVLGRRPSAPEQLG